MTDPYNLTLLKKQVSTYVYYIYIQGQPFLLNDVNEILEALEDTAYPAGDRIVIYDKALQDVLEVLGVVEVNIHRSCTRGKNYEKFNEAVMKLIPSDEEEEDDTKCQSRD